jgi:HKD family nuclease
MVHVSFLRPIDQFSGSRRLLQELIECLKSNDFDHLLISIAFAKHGPLLRLLPYIQEWKQTGKTIKAIFGVDLMGTSKQALEFALEYFDETYIIHSPSQSTFHPKFYLFYGNEKASCFYGSHNLTVGGTEINFEGGTKIDFDRPDDEASFEEALSCWESLLPPDCIMTIQLDRGFLNELIAKGYVSDETVPKPRKARTVDTSADGSSAKEVSKSLFPRSFPKPQSPIPKRVAEGKTAVATPAKSKIVTVKTVRPKKIALPIPETTSITSEALVIQIVPHHNGEVFLSKLAVNQNPTFFAYPFTGKSVPKKTGKNKPYPQREPDPIVNIIVYDSKGNLALTKLGYNLNTVYYEPKSEIRITISSDVREAVNEYAILVMRQTEEDHDYDMEIFNAGSNRYEEYLSVCNQTLPSGGAAQARKMGWL